MAIIKVYTGCNYNTLKLRQKKEKLRIATLNKIMIPFVILDNKKIFFTSYTEIKTKINDLVHKSKNKEIDIFYQKQHDVSEYFEKWILLTEKSKKAKLINSGIFTILSDKNKFIKRKISINNMEKEEPFICKSPCKGYNRKCDLYKKDKFYCFDCCKYKNNLNL